MELERDKEKQMMCSVWKRIKMVYNIEKGKKREIWLICIGVFASEYYEWVTSVGFEYEKGKWFIFIVRHAAGIWISERDIDILLLQRKKESRMCSSYILIAIDDKATGVEFDFENRGNY